MHRGAPPCRGAPSAPATGPTTSSRPARRDVGKDGVERGGVADVVPASSHSTLSNSSRRRATIQGLKAYRRRSAGRLDRHPRRQRVPGHGRNSPPPASTAPRTCRGPETQVVDDEVDALRSEETVSRTRRGATVALDAPSRDARPGGGAGTAGVAAGAGAGAVPAARRRAPPPRGTAHGATASSPGRSPTRSRRRARPRSQTPRSRPRSRGRGDAGARRGPGHRGRGAASGRPTPASRGANAPSPRATPAANEGPARRGPRREHAPSATAESRSQIVAAPPSHPAARRRSRRIARPRAATGRGRPARGSSR